MAGRRRRTRSQRGGKGGTEPAVVVLEREAQVIALSIEGRGQHEIARTLGISQAAVSKILARVTARWRDQNTDRLHRDKMLHLLRLDNVYREAMAAWQRSQQPRTRKRQRKFHDATGEARGSEAELISEASAGDPKYLDAARRALVERARLLGEAPERSVDGPHVFTLKLPELPNQPAGEAESPPAVDPTEDEG